MALHSLATTTHVLQWRGAAGFEQPHCKANPAKRSKTKRKGANVENFSASVSAQTLLKHTAYVCILSHTVVAVLGCHNRQHTCRLTGDFKHKQTVPVPAGASISLDHLSTTNTGPCSFQPSHVHT